MKFIVFKRIAAAALFVSSTAVADTDSEKPPRFLTVPVLGLRLPLDRIKLEPFPEDLRATCGQIEDNEVHTVRVWTFAQAKDAVSTYYVLTGYFKRRNPDSKRKLYELWDNGAVFTVGGGKCGGDDAAETFDGHDPNAELHGNVPDRILTVLALDLAAQTVKAFGGPDKLRAAIIAQRIDYDTLPPELREAFKPYFPETK